MTRLISTTLLLMSLAATCFAQQHHEAHEDNVDIDEWQVMRVAAAKDPFEKSRQFTINFANYADEEWCYPLPGGKVISHFGGARRHGGTDIKTKAGDTIRAAFPGEVILSGPYYAYGNFVVLRHANGLETAYSHNMRNLVKKGTWVQAGQPIALTGRTGRATTEHLHFETRVRGKSFDSSKIYDHAKHSIKREVMVFTKQKNGQIHITVADKEKHHELLKEHEKEHSAPPPRAQARGGQAFCRGQIKCSGNRPSSPHGQIQFTEPGWPSHYVEQSKIRQQPCQTHSPVTAGLPSYSCNPPSIPLTAGKPGSPTAPASAHLRSNGNKQARQISSSRHAHRTRKKNHIPTAARCDDQRTALQSPTHRAA